MSCGTRCQQERRQREEEAQRRAQEEQVRLEAARRKAAEEEAARVMAAQKAAKLEATKKAFQEELNDQGNPESIASRQEGDKEIAGTVYKDELHIDL